MSPRIFRLLTFGGRIHYAWVVAISSGMIALIGVQPLSLFAVFLEPISKDLGASRGVVSSAYSIAWISLGISSLLSGWATDTVGTRKILVYSTILTVIPLSALYWTTNIWWLFFWYGIVYGFARSGYTTPAFVTITLWFKKKQGLAVGIMSSGLAVGPAIFAPIFQYLIDSFGWKMAFVILGIVSGIILAPCVWIIRNHPEDLGLKAYGEDEPGKAGLKDLKPAHQPVYYKPGVSNFFRFAATTQPFLLLPLIHFVGCVSHSIPLAHMVVMATDTGMQPIVASTVLGLATAVSAASRMAAPMVADKWGGRKALVLFIAMQSVGILWLLWAHDMWSFYTFAVLFGLGYGGEMTPFPILNRQYYGAAPIGMLFGFQTMLASLGMGLGGFIGGWLYDINGNYIMAIWVAVGMGVVGAAFSYFLVDPFKPGMRRFFLAGEKIPPHS